MGVKAKNLTEVIDEFSVRFLERITPRHGEEGTVTLEQELGIFKELVRWAAIKNKISPDGGDEGGKLSEYRKQLDGGSVGGNGRTGRTGADVDGEAGADETFAGIPHPNRKRASEDIGDGIKALIAQKPSNVVGDSAEDDGDVQDDVDDLGDESAFDAGDDGCVRPSTSRRS